ncbi:MAG: glycosyltransferase [Nitrospiria bacterium]
MGEGYPVNRVLIEGLRRAGATVWECRVPLWDEAGGEAAKRGAAGRGVFRPRLALAWAAAWLGLARRWLSGPETDVVIVGYLGHVDVLLARLLTRRPIVLNALYSLYDTVVNDRRLAPPRSLGARALRLLDRSACRAADLIFLDTEAHIAYFRSEFGLPASRCHRVFVGSDRAKAPSPSAEAGASCRVLFVGTFIPLHGVPTILGAAQRVLKAAPGVRLRLIGQGQEFSFAAETAAEGRLSNVELVGRWAGREELARETAAADVCLGIFGATAKAGRVIPSKVFDALAAGKPLITADTPAARELLTHGVDAWLCPPADPQALADAILTLARDAGLRRRLADGARRTYELRCSPEAIGKDAVQVLERVVAAKGVIR